MAQYESRVGPPAATLSSMSLELRRRLFRHFAATGRPPGLTRQEADALAAERAVVLDETGSIAFANPFAAGPAAYRVTTSARTYSAVCVWDALGIAAALAKDAAIDACCPDCDEALRLTVRDRTIEPTAHAVHSSSPQ